jgi:phage terminase large subunit-like protein
MPSLSLTPLAAQLATICARRKPTVTIDPARYAWYDETCPCGVPAGECKEHPRARPSQRPPDGDWRVWAVVAGRGFGKTRTGAEWVIDRVRNQGRRHVALVGRTADDAAKIMVRGDSGILAISAPDFRPKYEPSKDQLTWPNGAIGHVYSAAEPGSLRGPQHDDAWLDELGAWDDEEAFSNLMFGLRIGDDPRCCVTTTPRSTKLVKELLGDPQTTKSGGSTHENEIHLARNFFAHVISSYEGTRLGRQEIHAELLELSEGAWFATFDPARHVSESAEFHPSFPVRLAIDCGTSQHTGAVWFQVRQLDEHRHRVTVFRDFLSSGAYSAKNAVAIKERNTEPPNGGRLDLVRLDPAARQETGIGPAAYSEYARVFGRMLDKWPSHGVVDGLEFMEMLLETGCLVIHPRCKDLIAALKDYKRKVSHGVVINYPADNQSPHEDMVDALRGGIRDRFPEGREGESRLRQVHAGRM